MWCHRQYRIAAQEALMAKILLMEDDEALAETVEDWLIMSDHMVDIARDGREALARIEAFSYDLFVLDWEVPQTTGIELCSKLRAKGVMSPILMLTGKSAIEDKTTGFDVGVDDYLTKPFHPKELVARVQALLRRPAQLVSQTLTCGDITIDTNSKQAKQGQDVLNLQPMEFTLLEFFVRHPNQPFSPEALLSRLWHSDAEVSSQSVYTCLARLRKKIEKNGVCPIATIRGVGYMLKRES
jgi:DNA-binding response OmpR family regulator